MPGFELGRHGRYILAPGKSVSAGVIDQAFSRIAQSRDLAGLYSGLFGRNGRQTYSGQAAAHPFLFKISQRLVVIIGICLFAG
jgi:hypothetical protein